MWLSRGCPDNFCCHSGVHQHSRCRRDSVRHRGRGRVFSRALRFDLRLSHLCNHRRRPRWLCSCLDMPWIRRWQEYVRTGTWARTAARWESCLCEHEAPKAVVMVAGRPPIKTAAARGSIHKCSCNFQRRALPSRTYIDPCRRTESIRRLRA